MKLRRVFLAVLITFSAVVVAPLPSAYAGGPTSVLMVNPNAQQARAAYISDSAYSALAAAVGEGGVGAPPPGLAEGGGEDVRLTWLIHDVQIWRIDRIHLTSADGMWIETVTNPSGEIWSAPSGWHRPADAAALTAVLTTAGLLSDSEVAPTSPAGAEAEATVPTPATPVPAIIAAGLGGLVLGAAGALVALQARRRTPVERPDRVSLSG